MVGRLSDRRHALKLRALRKQIKEGIESLERGDFIELDFAELDEYFKRLAEKGSQD